MAKLAIAKLVIDIIEGLARAYKDLQEARDKTKDSRIKELEKEIETLKGDKK